MQRPEVNITSWEQLSLLKGGPVEITLQIGVFPEADHAQFLLQAAHAATHELYLMEARHHVSWSEVGAELERWLGRVVAMVREFDEPF